MLIEIASVLNIVEFDDVKEFSTIKDMCDKMIIMHRGDQNLFRAKAESIRGKYDFIRMEEGEKKLFTIVIKSRKLFVPSKPWRFHQ